MSYKYVISRYNPKRLHKVELTFGMNGSRFMYLEGMRGAYLAPCEGSIYIWAKPMNERHTL